MRTLVVATERPRAGAIIVAAGQSARMVGIDKVFAPIGGRPLLAWTVAAFEQSPLIDEIIVAVARQSIQEARALGQREGWRKVSQVCRGGLSRQDSVRQALWRLGKCDWVLVHDGARPCVDESLIRAGLEAAAQTGAAIPALPLFDTVKRADAAGAVRETVDRSDLYTAQTPQVFRYDILWAAHQAPPVPAPGGGMAEATDDAVLVERQGMVVRLFPGSPRNIKVTVPDHLDMAAFYLAGPAVCNR